MNSPSDVDYDIEPVRAEEGSDAGSVVLNRIRFAHETGNKGLLAFWMDVRERLAKDQAVFPERSRRQ
jgi:hypothetical protein